MSATALNLCGCYVTSSMFAESQILSVGHCQEHAHLFSDNKTLKEMAGEIGRIQHDLIADDPPPLGIHIRDGIGTEDKVGG